MARANRNLSLKNKSNKNTSKKYSRKNIKSSRKQRRSRKNNKYSRKVLKSRRRASRQKGGAGEEVIFVETKRDEDGAALKATSIYDSKDIKLDGHIVIVSDPKSSKIKHGDYFFRREPSNPDFRLTYFEKVKPSELNNIKIEGKDYKSLGGRENMFAYFNKGGLLKILHTKVYNYEGGYKLGEDEVLNESKQSDILTASKLQGLSEAYATKSGGRNISSYIEGLIKQNINRGLIGSSRV